MAYRRKFFFGKHKGEFIDEVMKEDLQYIKWCMENVEFFKFNDNELRMYNEEVNKIIHEKCYSNNRRYNNDTNYY